MEYQTNDHQSKPSFLPVGTWRPVDGPTMTDELFIHVSHGFRKKILPIVTFHVS